MRVSVMKDRLRASAGTSLCVGAVLLLLPGFAHADADARFGLLESSYRFLVSDRTQGGVLYHASAGRLKDMALPLSFHDTADYWGQHVCQYPSRTCAVVDIYDASAYTLEPAKSAAGDLQTERVNIHNGTNIYDAATWQIAIVLGAVKNGFVSARYVDAYQLANNQNHLLQQGYSGDATHFVVGANRAVTREGRFEYNGTSVSQSEQAYLFRMFGRGWLNTDPFVDTRYAALISTQSLPANNDIYKPGKISWTDWKPFTGENAWAFLIGPLQAAYIHYVEGKKGRFVPFDDIAVQNALAVLPTFSAMQSNIGAVYYAPSGTVRNQGLELVNPHEVAVENNASLLAGLQILRDTLQAQLAHDDKLDRADVAAIHAALACIHVMINGGKIKGEKFFDERTTAGLLAFFRQHAWLNGEFVQGGIVNANGWQPTRSPKAVDANTWTISVLGTKRVDAWFGFGASYRVWQQIKQWSAYGRDKTLWGVGFSDLDGNGINGDGTFRRGVMSSEWTAGAVNMLRNMIAFYGAVAPTSSDYAMAKTFLESLQRDEAAMIDGIQALRYDRYVTTDFEGKPQNYRDIVPQFAQPYLYSNSRYLVPFGWYANPLPSTCATAWMVMLANAYDPLAYAGKAN